MYYLYLEAVSVRNSKSQSTSEVVQVTGGDTTERMLFDLCSFTNRDLEFIVKFSEEHRSDVFRQLLQSFCPSIYGHELVKGNTFILNKCIFYNKFYLLFGGYNFSSLLSFFKFPHTLMIQWVVWLKNHLVMSMYQSSTRGLKKETRSSTSNFVCCFVWWIWKHSVDPNIEIMVNVCLKPVFIFCSLNDLQRLDTNAIREYTHSLVKTTPIRVFTFKILKLKKPEVILSAYIYS